MTVVLSILFHNTLHNTFIFYSLYTKFWCGKHITDPEAYVEAYFGEGKGEIYIENVQCNGSESSLEDCPASEVGVHDCTHSEDAGVRCQSMCVNARIMNHVTAALKFSVENISLFILLFC